MEAKRQLKSVVFLGAALLVLGFLPTQGFADVIGELKNKIADKESDIAALEQEIAAFENELTQISGEKATLESEIRRIDVTRRKLAADIRLTQQNVNSAELNLDKLALEIGDTGANIENKTEALKRSIRRMNEIDDLSLAEMVLASSDIGSFWNDMEEIERFQSGLNEEVRVLSVLKSNLEDQRVDVDAEQARLVNLRQKLLDQKFIVDSTVEEKNELLAETKNQESNYQAILDEKRAQKAAFEEELRKVESELEYELDPNKIPSAGSGVLLWPLAGSANQSCYTGGKTAENCITQYFGNTEFARRAAYNGQGHNGIDFRASVGTEVRAALSGVVKEINIKAAPGCQYGKWVLIQHNNGLTTLYAHLSLVRVEKGDTVLTSDTIGYSGKTGYATGPHLHFTVYASGAVSLRNFTCRSGITVPIPVAAYSAYLNPLDYL